MGISCKSLLRSSGNAWKIRRKYKQVEATSREQVDWLWKTIADYVATVPLQNKRSKSTINLVMAHFEGNPSRASFKFYISKCFSISKPCIWAHGISPAWISPYLLGWHHLPIHLSKYISPDSNRGDMNGYEEVHGIPTYFGGADHLGQSSILATTK